MFHRFGDDGHGQRRVPRFGVVLDGIGCLQDESVVQTGLPFGNRVVGQSGGAFNDHGGFAICGGQMGRDGEAAVGQVLETDDDRRAFCQAAWEIGNHALANRGGTVATGVTTLDHFDGYVCLVVTEGRELASAVGWQLGVAGDHDVPAFAACFGFHPQDTEVM